MDMDDIPPTHSVKESHSVRHAQQMGDGSEDEDYDLLSKLNNTHEQTERPGSEMFIVPEG